MISKKIFFTICIEIHIFLSIVNTLIYTDCFSNVKPLKSHAVLEFGDKDQMDITYYCFCKLLDSTDKIILRTFIYTFVRVTDLEFYILECLVWLQ